MFDDFDKPWKFDPNRSAYIFAYGAAPGWRRRPEYKQALPYGKKCFPISYTYPRYKDRYSYYRPWRFARKFEDLKSRVKGNQMNKPNLHCPYRNRERNKE